MASKTLLFLFGTFLLLLTIQLQVDALRILPQQLQQEANIPRMKGMTTLQGADENDGEFTKPEFSLMSKRLAKKDAEGGCSTGDTKSDDWLQGLAGLGELLAKAAESQQKGSHTTQTTPGTGSHTTDQDPSNQK